MRLIKAGIIIVKVIFKSIIDIWKSINRWEREMKEFSKPIIKALKEHRREIRQKAIKKKRDELFEEDKTCK